MNIINKDLLNASREKNIVPRGTIASAAASVYAGYLISVGFLFFIFFFLPRVTGVRARRMLILSSLYFLSVVYPFIIYLLVHLFSIISRFPHSTSLHGQSRFCQGRMIIAFITE